MTEFEKLVYDYLVAHGPSKTKEMREKLAPDVSPNTFRQRLGRMSHQKQIENIRGASRNQPGAWQAINTVIYASAAGEVAPPSGRVVMRVPVLVHAEMRPARRGAGDHTQYASRRGDDRVAPRAPIHMCSQLKGSM